MIRISALRAASLAMPGLAAAFLLACQGASPESSTQPITPDGLSAESGPAGAVAGPASLAVSEEEFSTLAKSARAAANCNVGFNDPWGLVLLPDQASNTFALPPWYTHDCEGSGAARVLENPSSRYGEAWGSDYGHYHLGYQRGDFCLTTDDFQPGIMTNGTCVEVANPEREDRILGSHSPDHWIRLYAFGPTPIGGTTPELTFHFKGIRVKEGAKVRVYARKASGGWVTWQPLNAARWVINGGESVREVLISAVPGEVKPFFIDDLVVNIP
jgi:hypothetical protein